MTEVAMGHAGIVLGLEVSRLARNNADCVRDMAASSKRRCQAAHDRTS
nr:hypothetical protein [Rhizobium leguminosarum]